MHPYFLAKFTTCFRQVYQVRVSKKDHEDLCWPLIDTYNLIVYKTLPIFSEKEISQHKNYPILYESFSPLEHFFSTVRPIFYKIWTLMVYIQLKLINEGSAEVLVILVQDFYLPKTLGELGQQIWMHFYFFPQVHQVF